MEYDRKRFREEFPHLAKELEEAEGIRIPIRGIRTCEIKDIDVVRLLRRCDNEEQALEIIEYLRKRGEITEEYAAQILKQLKEKGLRSFGSKISWGFFEKEYRNNF
ncbi:MAG: DUF2095 family protein [Candidatus Jordarchaeales archaeon]